MPDEKDDIPELTSIDLISGAYYAILAMGEVDSMTKEQKEIKARIIARSIEIIDRNIEVLYKVDNDE